MSYLLKQSQTARPLLFLMVDSADHITGKTGLSPTVTLSKNGGSFAAPAGAVAAVGNGWYRVAGHATDANTLGPLVLNATATGADPCDVVYEVVSFDPSDDERLGLTALPAASAGGDGGLPVLDENGLILTNVARVNGNQSSAEGLSSLGSYYAANDMVPAEVGSVTVASIGTGVITAASIASGAFNGKGDWLLSSGYTAPPTAAAIATAVLAAGDVDGYSLEATLKLCLAALAGKLSGAAGTTVTIRAADDSKARITATVDSDGNRTAITLDATG